MEKSNKKFVAEKMCFAFHESDTTNSFNISQNYILISDIKLHFAKRSSIYIF